MNPDFNKSNGLLPVIVQDACSLQVLMLGYMNPEALQHTRETGKVTFYSRSKQRLWTKGERSGNVLVVKSIREDCDRDSLLILAEPAGPTCHTGSVSCFDAEYETVRNPPEAVPDRVSPRRNQTSGIEDFSGSRTKATVYNTDSAATGHPPDTGGFLYQLEKIIHERISSRAETSYTFRLFQKGINKIAQKVGEEAVELVIEAKDNDAGLFKNEAADLLYHYLILLKAKGYSLSAIEAVLKERNKA